MDRDWSVAVAACFAAFFTVVVMTNAGFFYVSFIEEFNVDRESASWPASVMSIIAHSSGILVYIAQSRLSVFHIGMIGSVFLWAGILGAVWAPNITWMTVTLGVIHGVGLGVVAVTLINVVMMYFDKYRGVSSGLKFAGYSMCSLLYPIILTALKEAYGLRGTMLVYAALSMNVTALTLLLKEPPWMCTASTGGKNRRPPPELHVIPTPYKTTLSSGRCADTVQLRVSVAEVPTSTADLCFYAPNSASPENATTRYLRGSPRSPKTMPEYWPKTNDECTTSKAPCSNFCAADSYPRPSFWTLQTVQKNRCTTIATRIVESLKPDNIHTSRGRDGMHTTGVSSSNEKPIADTRHKPSLTQQVFHLLASPRFYVFVLAVVAIDYTWAVFPATIVDYALDKGSCRRHADLAVTYCAPAELLGRVALPLIGDHRIVSRTTLVTACFFLLAAALLALPATVSFLSYILLCSCTTMLEGCLMTMKPVIIADHFGIETVPVAWGFGGVVLIPLLLCNPAITGYFRDLKRSYDGLYQLQAGINAGVGCLFVLLAVLDRGRKKEWATKEVTQHPVGFDRCHEFPVVNST